MQLIALDELTLDQDFTEPRVALCGLVGDGLLELGLRDQPVLHEDVAETVAAIHDGRVADASLVEVDVAEALPMRDAQTAALLAHREQLEHIGEARLLETSLDRHQRSSSMTRPSRSGHSITIFSASRNDLSAIAG